MGLTISIVGRATERKPYTEEVVASPLPPNSKTALGGRGEGSKTLPNLKK